MDKVEGQLPLCQGVIWNGAPVMDAEFGCTQNVATIQTAWRGKEEQTHVIGLTILLVWIMLTTTDLKIEVPISGKTCPFPGSLPHGSWTCEMQEIPILGTSFLDEGAQSYQGKLNWKESQPHPIWYISALQCRLECEAGYVAQRTPLITCVNGEYAKGCHYLQTIFPFSLILPILLYKWYLFP